MRMHCSTIAPLTTFEGGTGRKINTTKTVYCHRRSFIPMELSKFEHVSRPIKLERFFFNRVIFFRANLVRTRRSVTTTRSPLVMNRSRDVTGNEVIKAINWVSDVENPVEMPVSFASKSTRPKNVRSYLNHRHLCPRVL